MGNCDAKFIDEHGDNPSGKVNRQPCGAGGWQRGLWSAGAAAEVILNVVPTVRDCGEGAWDEPSNPSGTAQNLCTTGPKIDDLPGNVKQ
jgi:hypothetical protein